jgi:hypothetical protein
MGVIKGARIGMLCDSSGRLRRPHVMSHKTVTSEIHLPSSTSGFKSVKSRVAII